MEVGVRGRLVQGRDLLILLRAAALAGLPRDLCGGSEENAAANPTGSQPEGRTGFRECWPRAERPARRLRDSGTVPAGGAAPGRCARGRGGVCLLRGG